MRIPIFRKVAGGVFLVLLLVPRLSAQSSLVLNNAFIEKYKNRATIDSSFVIDAALSRPHRISSDGDDGDLHFAGRTDDVGLPMVAEIVNAGLPPQRTVVKSVQQEKNTGDTVTLSGVWRIWFEHPPKGNGQQVQGDPVAPDPGNTNPDHVFQIHPLTKIQDQSLVDSFMPIEGYQTKDATEAFMNYENKRSQISVNPSAGTTTIVTSMGGFNYVEFVMEVTDAPKNIEDGELVFASVFDLNGELLVKHRRMVFVKGTPPEQVLKRATPGQRLHVLGVPRIDLAVISWRVQHRTDRPEAMTWGLPYEVVIVATYDSEN